MLNMQDYTNIYMVGSVAALYLAVMIMSYVKNVLKTQGTAKVQPVGHVKYTALAGSLLVVGTISHMPLLMAYLTTPAIA